ncbi:efflux RND transporter periplasmic adaptor subunit [Microbulbifer agarilyticus]|uniref:efflux RND transporter periplasmic adaptor subunit n=1 Tax=Microbulbifer agarilyticus TaxID=260552 RepID=UPI001C9741BF|nr:efflux RND transporter periplasmic adaptor subunit [Microbulbifer agarilyticus]MBY6192041.1 efflux RND transporter periplasmic adaptor subunit [Microbulbifer agarilyticus]
MTLTGNFRSLSLVLFLAAATSLTGCGNTKDDTEQKERQWPVKVAEVSNSGTAGVRHFAGQVKAVQALDMSFQVAGKLGKFSMQEGQVISKGTVIAALDDRDYRRQVREAKVRVELLEKTLERQRSLAERKIISVQALDEAESNYDLAKVTLENAQQQLSYATLRAPFDAIVTKRLVENHTNVKSGEGIVRLQDISEVRIQISVPENLLATMDRRQVDSVTATFEFLPGEEFALEYRELQAEANKVTQTYLVELGMPRPQQVQIYPGMTARVNLKLNAANGTLRIPLSAVQTNAEGAPFVWRINEEQRVTQTAVELGRTDGELVQVMSGLQADMQLVAAGGQHLYEGALVRNYLQRATVDAQAGL